jgi:hypothetical protein
MAATKPSSTTTKKTATKAPAKPAAKTPAKSAAKPAPKAPPKAKPAPALVVVESASLSDAAPKSAPVGEIKTAFKLKTLVEQVIKTTGAKKKGVKEIVEATLGHLGAALSRGEDVNLPPLGKAKVGRQKDKAGGELIIVKLNRSNAKPKGEKPANQGLADDEEDS